MGFLHPAIAWAGVASVALPIIIHLLFRRRRVAIEWADRHKCNPDILVNCTPVGMHPNVDESPYEKHHLRPSMVVFDAAGRPSQDSGVSIAPAPETFDAGGRPAPRATTQGVSAAGRCSAALGQGDGRLVALFSGLCALVALRRARRLT